MTIPATALDAEFESREVSVTARMTLAYAAAIGCTQERYLDDARTDGLIAPPPFCVSLEWLLAGDAEALNRLGIEPQDQRRAVHASQDTLFHRPLFAGETVTVAGRIEAIHKTRAGASVTSRLEIAGAEGDPITTSRCDVIYRGVETDADARAERQSDLASSDTPINYVETTELPISRTFPHVYSECASIWNPIHTERQIALAAGLPDIIVHGTALWAIVWKELNESHGNVSRLSGRFMAMAIPGHPATLRTSRLDPQTESLAFRLDNDRGDPTIDRGQAKFSKE